jgi:cytochrome c peroxidase
VAVTHRTTDEMVFKVPSLRNVVMTAPYFHNGGTTSLPEAVRMMGHYQLGRDLTDAQVESIVTYLHALTGQIPNGTGAAPPAR